MNDTHKLPRLYVCVPMSEGAPVPLTAEQAHYLKNVLRKGQGDHVRVFNGAGGEWLLELQELGKKGGMGLCARLLAAQSAVSRRVHLLFAPIKKARLDFLIEKAVELGATDLHPVITSRTENRHLNTDRMTAQIIEAAEQCERLDVPQLHAARPLADMLAAWPVQTAILAAIERQEAPPLSTRSVAGNEDIGGLIGPEGGFSPDEIDLLGRYETVKPVSLGPRILRAETAAMLFLSCVFLK